QEGLFHQKYYAHCNLLSRCGVVDSFLRSGSGSFHGGERWFGRLGDTNSPAKHHWFAFGGGLDRICGVECKTQGPSLVPGDELLETIRKSWKKTKLVKYV